MDQYIFYYVLPEGGKKTYPYLADFPCSVGDQVEIPFGRGNKPVSGEVKDIFRCLECDAPVPVDKARRIIRNLSAPETPELPEDETPAPVQKPAPAAPKASPFVVLDSDPANNEVIAQAEQLIAAKDPQAIFEWAMDHLDAESDVILDEVTKALQAASELGHTQAMLTLGDMFLTGFSTEVNVEAALELYKIAAGKGEIAAFTRLGTLYLDGIEVDADFSVAYDYFSLGVLLGDDPECLYRLGDMYREGKHVDTNETFAFRLYVRALNVARSKEDYRDTMPFILFRLGNGLLQQAQDLQDVRQAHNMLCDALSGFYEQLGLRDDIPDHLAGTKKLIDRAEKIIEKAVDGGEN